MTFVIDFVCSYIFIFIQIFISLYGFKLLSSILSFQPALTSASIVKWVVM